MRASDPEPAPRRSGLQTPITWGLFNKLVWGAGAGRDPCSKRGFGDWWSTTAGERLVKIGKAALDHRRFWDAMHAIDGEALVEIERRIAAKAIDVFDAAAPAAPTTYPLSRVGSSGERTDLVRTLSQRLRALSQARTSRNLLDDLAAAARPRRAPSRMFTVMPRSQPDEEMLAPVERISATLRYLGYDAYTYALAAGDDPLAFWAKPHIYRNRRDLPGAAVAIRSVAFNAWKYPDGQVRFHDVVPHVIDHGPQDCTRGFRPRWCWTGPVTGTKLDNWYILSADASDIIRYLRAALPAPTEPMCQLFTGPDDHVGSYHQEPVDWYDEWAKHLNGH